MKYQIVKAKTAAKQTHLKLLIYGESGAGKTYFSVGTKNPLVLLTEMNGQASILAANPNADIIHVSDANMLAQLLRDLCESPDMFSAYDMIVIDSLTEMQRLVKDRITGGSARQLKLQEWGKLAGDTLGMIRRIRSIPFNVCCLALLETQVAEETGERHLKPMFEGRKTSSEIAQYFNAVGLLYRTVTADETVRKVMFEGPSRIMCKPVGSISGIVDIQETKLSKIISLVQGGKNEKA